MTPALSSAVLAVCLCCSCHRYSNPILYADWSDPDVVAVDGEYWMTASSFGHVPGLPILHSTDLVHWELVSYALPDLGPGFDAPSHGNGVWAPSIRYHDGVFWIFWGDPDRGIFRVTASGPRGPWSAPVLVREGLGLIDPCPLWDGDGRVWLVHAWARSRAGIKSILSLCELNADCTACIGDDELIFDGRTNGNPTVEGPKFYKRDGMYYIMAPAGGVKTGWQLVMRSASVHGPYEWKVAMHEADLPIADKVSSEARGPHQGGWVTDARGDDWFVHFEDRYAWGRVTHLQPLTWDSDGWCIIGRDTDGDGIGEPVSGFRSPAVAKGKHRTVTAVDGTGLEWQWNANPGKASGVEIRNLWDAPELRLKKIEGPARNYEMEICELPAASGERCGVTVFGRSYAAVDILRNEDSTLTLRYLECFNAKKGSAEEVLWQSPVPDGCGGISVKVAARESDAAASHSEKTGTDEGMLCSFAFRFDGIEEPDGRISTYVLSLPRQENGSAPRSAPTVCSEPRTSLKFREGYWVTMTSLSSISTSPAEYA